MMTECDNDLLEHGLLVDLETTQQGRILKIGAAFGDRQFLRIGQFDLPAALMELDRFAAGATCVVGHNLVQHDLTVLAEKNPALALLRLPVIDTLFLSPICFPENPYHRLVKDYKLVSESLNDPVADARLAGTLLTEEIQSLQGMAQAAPDVFRCLQFLLCSDSGEEPLLVEGMQSVFQAAGARDEPTGAEGRSLLRGFFDQVACRTASAFLSETDFTTREARWALAYLLAWLRVAGSDSVLPPWIRLHNRLVVPLTTRLRDVPCDRET